MIESAPENRRSGSPAYINAITVPPAFAAPLIGLSVENDPSKYSWFYILLLLLLLLLAFSGFATTVIAYSLKEVRTTAADRSDQIIKYDSDN